jgi:hypothetical protein
MRAIGATGAWLVCSRWPRGATVMHSRRSRPVLGSRFARSSLAVLCAREAFGRFRGAGPGRVGRVASGGLGKPCPPAFAPDGNARGIGHVKRPRRATGMHRRSHLERGTRPRRLGRGACRRRTRRGCHAGEIAVGTRSRRMLHRLGAEVPALRSAGNGSSWLAGATRAASTAIRPRADAPDARRRRVELRSAVTASLGVRQRPTEPFRAEWRPTRRRQGRATGRPAAAPGTGRSHRAAFAADQHARRRPTRRQRAGSGRRHRHRRNAPTGCVPLLATPSVSSPACGSRSSGRPGCSSRRRA